MDIITFMTLADVSVGQVVYATKDIYETSDELPNCRICDMGDKLEVMKINHHNDITVRHPHRTDHPGFRVDIFEISPRKIGITSININKELRKYRENLL